VGYQRNEIVEDLMAVDPKQHIHAPINRLNDDEVRALSTILDTDVTALPLTGEDVLLAAPIVPANESADELIATVRHWWRGGGDV